MRDDVKDKPKFGTIGAALLAWYDGHRRDLPWRRSPDPYHVWVSEIMLQQTRVETVIPYYERWLAAFPHINALATADLHDVLKQWEGLGYYSRARNLHSAARLVRERHAGSMPGDFAGLRALPGIGDYTAAAIASIAYAHPVAAVDGNVRRVIARLYDLARPTATTLRRRATQLLDAQRPGDFNQALMDLGAMICTPRDPRCSACPLAGACRARARGTTQLRPAAERRKPLPHERVLTLITIRAERVLLERRAAHGLLGGLWQFPEVTALPAVASHVGDVTHTFSHKRITYEAYAACPPAHCDAHQQWVPIANLHEYALPAAQRKIEALLYAWRLTADSPRISIGS